ncbi:hypothetical protein GUITHDRAFT_110286 [Guillardia theta CCMP2712]|uniref:Purine permease n=1 Tax=Guillardia theta (strain CCMP2712) TaxID=905079 RepID=L1J5M8_GUITC|nr:hypothetical protein GUITHDRAFT_110286 [Guillardia theta CCMP2712]EKX43833.1 hypothetical protein GUITHDRAFT_110286 [Guillardia theta CCMP2712]|eukprot:XP_005830813.1 hypothetical protein GUITHDRAFT_110286 [Guillardia theta CCMP2712]
MASFFKSFLADQEELEQAEPLNWKWLCTPRVPCSKPTKPPPFYKIKQALPWTIAIIMGFQHALAMIGGIVSVPLLLAGPFDGKMKIEEKEYLISCGLIASGILSLIQITQFKLGNTGYYLGTGMISVLGTSFTFVPIARSSMAFMMASDSNMQCNSDADCTRAWGNIAGLSIPGVSNPGQCNVLTNRCKYSGQEAYGAFLGTSMVCAFLEIFLSFVPRAQLRRAFPPIVTGTCVLLIGVGLTGTGMKYWGGGAFCADNYHKRMRVMRGPNMAGDWTQKYPSKSPCLNGACVPFKGALGGICSYVAPKYDKAKNLTTGDVTTCESFMDLPGVFPAQDDVKMSYTKCTNNGQVVLPFGSPEYVGLGFAVFLTLILIEVFGSPFLRNCEVALALLFGFFIAGVASYDNNGVKQWFVTQDRIQSAPGITFLWVYTFPLSVYAPAFIPLLICYIITTVETIGDITASAEASRVETEGEVFDSRVQGGLLADGLCSLIACLFTAPPNTTFSQNNGVIALTRCANKRAGYCCCGFLLAFGVIAKIAAIIASIPDCVLGGMTTFLFVNIVVSGIKILGPEIANRRNRFIVCSSLALGIGVAIVPQWATNALVQGGSSTTAKLARDSLVIILSTPYCFGTLAAIFLNVVIPSDQDDLEEEAEEDQLAAHKLEDGNGDGKGVQMIAMTGSSPDASDLHAPSVR